jgi:hypothetical protein
MRTLWGERPAVVSESESMSIEPRLQIHRCDDSSPPLNFAAAADAAAVGHSE